MSNVYVVPTYADHGGRPVLASRCPRWRRMRSSAAVWEIDGAITPGGVTRGQQALFRASVKSGIGGEHLLRSFFGLRPVRAINGAPHASEPGTRPYLRSSRYGAIGCP